MRTTTFNKIEAEFISKGLAVMQPNNQWFILSKEDSIDFIEACRRESLPILGVDGFIVSDEGIQSKLDDILDFTTKSYNGTRDRYNAAIAFINDRQDDMYFEIVCAE